MMKDKALEELFLAQKPHFSDNADFMSALSKRLDTVEYVKQHQDATIRRYKMMMVAAFVVGIISGAVAIGYLLSMPADEPLVTLNYNTCANDWFYTIADGTRYFTLLLSDICCSRSIEWRTYDRLCCYSQTQQACHLKISSIHIKH